MNWLSASAATAGSDELFRFLLFGTGLCLCLVIALVDIYILRHRRQTPAELGRPTRAGAMLPAMVAPLALILAVGLFLSGFRPYLDACVAPPEAIAISAEATAGAWQFTYEGGHISNELHLPTDRPVELSLTATDAVERLAIPALHLSRTAVPGRVATSCFVVPEAGTFSLLPLLAVAGAETTAAHRAVVHPAGDFATWLAAAADPLATMSPVEAGEIFVQRFGCLQCHALSTTRGVGPGLQGTLGQMREFTDGTRIVADADYLTQSILAPGSRIVEGFEPVMPDFTGRIDERQAAAIVDYLETLTAASEER